MVVAKTDLAHRRLGAAIAARRVQRGYAALAWGHLNENRVVIDAPLARHPQDRKRMMVVASGRPSRTDARVIARFAVADLLRLDLHSGRTHQIRVHLEHIGHPVIGDPVYAGGGSRRITGPLAGRPKSSSEHPEAGPSRRSSGIPPPSNGVPLEFRSEWPSDLRDALVVVGGEDLVARPDALSYLLFFNRDG